MSTMSPRTLNWPGPSTWLRRTYPAANSRATSASRLYTMPGLRVRVFFRNSSRGTVYCNRASAGTHTACSRPPANAPSTERRRYSYSRPAPSTGRSMKSRGGNTAAARPSALRSSAKWVASASPGVTMHSTRPRSFCKAAYSRARPAGGRPNSAAGPGFAKLAAIFSYSGVAFKSASYMGDLLSSTRLEKMVDQTA